MTKEVVVENRVFMEQKVLRQSLGVDVSKGSLSLCLGSLLSDLTKHFLAGSDVSNDQEGFEALLIWLESVRDSGVDLTVVMEATGIYHEALAYFLYDRGYAVSIMQSGRVKKYAQSLDQRSKTDALDSKMLSMLGCERELRCWEPPGAVLQELKALSRERSTLLKEKTIATNRLGALGSGAYSNQQTLKRYKRRIALLDKQMSEIELEMRELVRADKELSEKFTYLESIPGVSFVLTATVVAETGGFELITSAKQLTSYAGYDVVLRESGSYRGRTTISKKGNRRIRAVMHMPSMAAIRVNPTLKPFYQRLKEKKAKPIVALVAVQRKLLILMFELWKKNEYYDPEFEQKKAASFRETCCTG